MSKNRRSCGCQKKSCGCQKKSCGCNSAPKCDNMVNAIDQCKEYKQCAQEKCQKAECINNRANKIAQQALAAEKRAECLKEQAIEECKKANELWAEYEKCAKQGVLLMQEAECCLAKSTECYANLYEEVEGCNLDCFGYNKCVKEESNCGCKCNCGCNSGCNNGCSCGC